MRFEFIQDKPNFTTEYLEITLDQTLEFNDNLDNTGKEMRSRINLIQIIPGRDWGANYCMLN